MNVALPAGEPAVRTQTDRVHRRLRADIIAGRLAPGTRLAMEQLKTAYGVGLSPLREALSRLSSQGLVEQLSQRGFRVAGVSRRRSARHLGHAPAPGERSARTVDQGR